MSPDSAAKDGFVRVLIGPVIVNLVLIGSGYVASNAFIDDESRALAYVLASSLVLWVGFPIGIASYLRSTSEAGKTIGGTQVRVALWIAIWVGLTSSAVALLKIDASALHTLFFWELAAGAFSIAVACLAVQQDPMPFEIGGRVVRLFRSDRG